MYRCECCNMLRIESLGPKRRVERGIPRYFSCFRALAMPSLALLSRSNTSHLSSPSLIFLSIVRYCPALPSFLVHPHFPIFRTSHSLCSIESKAYLVIHQERYSPTLPTRMLVPLRNLNRPERENDEPTLDQRGPEGKKRRTCH